LETSETVIVKTEAYESTFNIRVECTKNLGDYNSIKISAYIADVPSSASIEDIESMIDHKIGPATGLLERVIKQKIRAMAGSTP